MKTKQELELQENLKVIPKLRELLLTTADDEERQLIESMIAGAECKVKSLS